MIFDWDLWPGYIAYESDAGHIERMRRGLAQFSDAMRAVQTTFAAATKAFSAVIAKRSATDSATPSAED